MHADQDEQAHLCADCGSSEIAVQGMSGRMYCAEHVRRCSPERGHPDAVCEGCGHIDWVPKAMGGLVCNTCKPWDHKTA